MRTFKPALNSKGLLAASVALLAGQALAEDAGRVSFVTGNVTASSPDGGSRTLRKGDVINGGDRISTGAGRLQIRFTDGGFVSLQPNTVFGVDQYLYANRKPEETSLFFSLLQGGLRTVTGAIGKVNKQSYKVRTPVATIGIRGTEYLASVTPTGLVVSVGSGFVNVANKGGEITGGAGQNIFVRDEDSIPGLSDEPAEVHASGPGGDQNQPGAGNPTAIGNVQSGNGDYIFLFTSPPSLPNSDLTTGTPSYLMAYYYKSSGSNLSVPVSVLATFDQNGSATGSTGAILSLFNASTTVRDPLNPDFATVDAANGTSLRVTDVGTVGNLSWGAFTNGSTSVNKVFDYCGDGCTGSITLGSTAYLPYVIGIPAASNLAHGTASYSLQGGTLPRDQNGNAGTLDSFKIDVDLDFATMNVAMQVTMPGAAPVALATQTPTGNTYNVTTTGSQPVGVLNIGTNNQFFLGSNVLSVVDSNGSCGPSGSSACSAAISGFFTGSGASQIGAAYEIDNNNTLDTITGAAALGMSNYNPNTTFANGPGYSSAYSYTNGYPGFSGGYNDPNSTDSSLTVTLDASGALQSATQGGTTVYDRGTALADDTGGVGALKWGRWYASNVEGDTVTVPDGGMTFLSNGNYLHYVIGPMTQPNIFLAFPQGATATYTYQGGTTATGSDGSTGQISSGSTLTVSFGASPTLAADLNLNMSSGSSYHMTGSGIAIGTSVNYALGSASGMPTFAAGSGNLSCSATGSGSCMASINGFFAGQQAQQIGLGYQVQDFSAQRTVNGAAAFGRGAITPPPPPLP